MPKPTPRKLYVLPEIVDPVRKCIQIYVPNEPAHLAAFWGALLDLTKQYNWERDDGHNALPVSLVWLEIFTIATAHFNDGCENENMFDIRLKPGDSCIIQKTINGGLSWDDAINLRTCADLAVLDGIQDAIDDGRIPPVDQPGGDGVVIANECKSYYVQLSANNRYLLPVPVIAGYSITIEQAKGVWYDGDFFWRCPDGSLYQIGYCVGDEGTFTPGDPLESAAHMKLIADIGGFFYDGYNTLINVPSSVTEETDVFFQANDASLTDNQGSITFKVTVCNYAAEINATMPVPEGAHMATYAPLAVGQEFDIDFYSSSGGNYGVNLAFSRCVDYEWVSTGGRVDAEGFINNTVVDCDGTANNQSSGWFADFVNASNTTLWSSVLPVGARIRITNVY